jgi:hypothetical protein
MAKHDFHRREEHAQRAGPGRGRRQRLLEDVNTRKKQIGVLCLSRIVDQE